MLRSEMGISHPPYIQIQLSRCALLFITLLSLTWNSFKYSHEQQTLGSFDFDFVFRIQL